MLCKREVHLIDTAVVYFQLSIVVHLLSAMVVLHCQLSVVSLLIVSHQSAVVVILLLSS